MNRVCVDNLLETVGRNIIEMDRRRIEMSIGDDCLSKDRSPVQVDSRRRTEGGIETEACRGSVAGVSFCGVSTDRTQNITKRTVVRS